MTAHLNSRRVRGIVAVRAETQAKPDLSTIKAAADELKKTFEAFKAERQEEIDAIKAGMADVVKTEKVDRINSAITELKDHQDKIAKEIARARLSGSEDGNEVKAARRFQARAQRKAESDVSEVDVDQYRAYKAAFTQLCRKNFNVDGLSADVRAALSVGSDPDGGYLVPAEVEMTIEKRVYDTSPMREIASVSTISTGAWEAPYQASKATHGGWVGERQSRSSTATPKLGMQRIEVHEHYAYPEATRTMLEDAALDVEAWLNEEVGDEFMRQENAAFVDGDGVMKPKGFVSAAYTSAAVTTADATRDWGKLQYVASGAAGAFPVHSGIASASDVSALNNIITALNPVYRNGAVFVMNRSTEGVIRNLVDGNGRPLLEDGRSSDGTWQYSIRGYRIVNLEDMDDVGSDAFALAFGNFQRGYKIIDRRGITVIRDELTNKPYVGFYTTKRVGGDVRNFDAIKLMKFAAS